MTALRGLAAYEISNHAKPGEESRHNLLYWRYGDYAGIGPGAHGRLLIPSPRPSRGEGSAASRRNRDRAPSGNVGGAGRSARPWLHRRERPDARAAGRRNVADGPAAERRRRSRAVGGARRRHPSTASLDHLELGLIERGSARASTSGWLETGAPTNSIRSRCVLGPAWFRTAQAAMPRQRDPRHAERPVRAERRRRGAVKKLRAR